MGASDGTWIQSLRAEFSYARNESQKPRFGVSRPFSLFNVDRRVSAPRSCFDDQRKDSVVGPNSPKSSRNKRSETTPDQPEKCSKLCCDSLSVGNPFQSALTRLRMRYHLEPEESARIRDQISRAESQDASYEREIIRLKRILAACPPPDQKAPTLSACKTSKPCMHACCDTSVLPPRASTEMLRLRRILQQLEHRRQSISRYLLTKRSFLSPIRRLPPELLEMVFSFAVLSGKEDASFFSKSASAVRLAHVCSHWRAITLDMSKLWATILLFSRPQQVDTSIDQLKFYAARAKALPLTIRCCNWPSLSLLLKLIPMSHRWRDITLRVENQFIDEKLGIVRQKIPLLESLSIWNAGERDGADTNNVFEDAPSLRRIILIAHYGHVWPFSWILPWEQITSLMLKPISLSVFSECIRNCPHLLYLNAVVQPRTAQVVQPMAELRSSLRKLVLRGLRCEETVLAHSFPNMVSLSIEMQRPSPEFLAFLARSSHLEMLALSSSSSAPTEILIALLLATPSLRLVHFKDQHTVMVTPRFYTPLVPPGPDDPFLPVEPQSLAELGVEGCTAFNDAVLLAFIQARGPSFDPHGIEKARLQVEGTPFDPEAELDYLLLDPTHTSHR